MRARAHLLGGTFDAASSNGTFRIHARLPYGGEST
jgi:signal transduction histidine kinase